MGDSVSQEDFKPIMIFCGMIAKACTNRNKYGLCQVKVKIKGTDEFQHSRF